MKQWLKQLNVLNRKRPAAQPEGENEAEGRERTPKVPHGQPNTLVQAAGGTSVDTRRAYAAGMNAAGGASGGAAGAKAADGATSPAEAADADSDQEVKRLRMAGAI